jgi:hypothetical protein
MSEIEFQSFGKIPRLFREVVITEKIDGTNAAIGITTNEDGEVNAVYAQSRNRIITPKEDNHGFGRWVADNYLSLIDDLGEGLHFGEWWGQGIGRKYGMTEKRFSLFNVKRWQGADFKTAQLGAVPVIERGEFSTALVKGALIALGREGSHAAPGFMNPEGVVVYHTAGNVMFKATIEGDEVPKALRQRETALAA